MSRSGRLQDRHVLLGVTGGIACYKSADLTSKLVQEGAQVTAVLSRGALNFIRPLTFEALSGRPALVEMFGGAHAPGGAYPHLDPARTADVMVIAPATAHFLAKLACGLADDLLATLALSVRAPKIICPAMNAAMWNSTPVQRNVQALLNDGVEILGPEEGPLACGEIGRGRLIAPEKLLERLVERFGRGPIGLQTSRIT